MMTTFTAEAGTDAFDDAAIETQTAWCKQRPLHHERSVQIGQYGVKQRRGWLNTQDGRITEGLHTEDETDAVRIERRVRLGRIKHHHANGIMGQQEGIQLLESKQRQTASQGTLADAQVVLALIDGQLNFPAFVIEHAQLQSGVGKGIKQGGDQTMQLTRPWIGAIAVGMHARRRLGDQDLGNLWLDPVFNHPNGQRVVQSLAGTRGQGREVAAIPKLLLTSEEDVWSQACQHERPTLLKGFEEGSRNKATVQQDKHARGNAAQESPTEPLFAGLTGSHNGVEDEMGGGFDQIDTASVGAGTGGVASREATKEKRSGRGIGHILPGADNCHPPSP